MADKQSSEIQGIARYTFHEGKVEEYKRLNDQCMEIVRAKDTGTLQYEVYFNDDESECIVIERYKDSDALIEHLRTSATSRRRSWRRATSPASSLVSRAQSSERI